MPGSSSRSARERAAHPFEISGQTVADCVEFVRNDLIGLAQKRIFRGMNHRLMEFRIHSLSSLDVPGFDRERTGRDLLGDGCCEPFGIIRQNTERAQF